MRLRSRVSLVTIDDSAATISGLQSGTARVAGSLVIDPGVVVKLNGSRIEAEIGATLIAEGTANDPVVFTSVEDDRYGAGGTFDLTGDGYTAYNPTAVTAPTTTIRRSRATGAASSPTPFPRSASTRP